MTLLPYTPHLYSLLASWYLERGLEVPPHDSLPVTGLIAFKEEIPIAAAFLYRTDSSIALLDVLISSPLKSMPPHTAKLLRKEANALLLEELSLKAKDQGHTILVAAVTHPNVKTLLKEKGFEENPLPASFFARRI